jgi:hypothetical protein
MPSRTLTRVEFVGVYLADSNGSVGPFIKSPAHAGIRPPLCKSKPATPVLGGFALSSTRQIQFQRAPNLSLIPQPLSYKVIDTDSDSVRVAAMQQTRKKERVVTGPSLDGFGGTYPRTNYHDTK